MSGYDAELDPLSISEFEDALALLCGRYLRSLAPWAPTTVQFMRLEARGDGLNVTYDRGVDERGPGLSISLRPAEVGKRGDK